MGKKRNKRNLICSLPYPMPDVNAHEIKRQIVVEIFISSQSTATYPLKLGSKRCAFSAG